MALARGGKMSLICEMSEGLPKEDFHTAAELVSHLGSLPSARTIARAVDDIPIGKLAIPLGIAADKVMQLRSTALDSSSSC